MRNSRVLGSAFFLALLVTRATAESESLFASLDQNQDGWLLSSEIDHQHRRLFERLLRTADRDQDRKLSSREFQAGLAPRQPAKPLVEKQGSELPGANALLLLLAKMDVNSNGQIEAEEVPEPFRSVFDRIEDRVGGEPDGVLDRRELTQAGPMLSQIGLRVAKRMDLDVDVELALLSEKQWLSVQNMTRPRSRGELLADPQRVREFFRRLDADGDGQINLAEVPEQFAERFQPLLERADRDHNDQVSEQELMTISRQRQTFAANRLSPAQVRMGIKRFITRLDRNGDRHISRQEAPHLLAIQFERFDTDGSGQLESDELAPVVELLSWLRQLESKPESSPSVMMSPEKQ